MPHNIVNAPLVPCWCTEKNRFTAAGAKKGGLFAKMPPTPPVVGAPTSGRESFKIQVRERLLPSLRAYNPGRAPDVSILHGCIRNTVLTGIDRARYSHSRRDQR